MDFFFTLLAIFGVNILLSGDNALIIALASRDLPPKHRKMATLIGCFGAVVLRIILTFIAVYLLEIPYLKVIGGLLLLFIAFKLITDNEDESVKNDNIQTKGTLTEAVKTIVVADAIMSLDNIVAIAGVANGNNLLIVIGLITSIPIIIWGSNFIRFIMNKFPITVIMGTGILGYTAGEMFISDARIEPLLPPALLDHPILPVIFAIAVIMVGVMFSHLRLRDAKFALSETLPQEGVKQNRDKSRI